MLAKIQLVPMKDVAVFLMGQTYIEMILFKRN